MFYVFTFDKLFDLYKTDDYMYHNINVLICDDIDNKGLIKIVLANYYTLDHRYDIRDEFRREMCYRAMKILSDKHPN